jgi:hypothetical protein
MSAATGEKQIGSHRHSLNLPVFNHAGRNILPSLLKYILTHSLIYPPSAYVTRYT